ERVTAPHPNPARHHRHEQEARTLAQRANSEAEVSDKILQPANPALVAADFLDGFDRAELPQCRVPRLRGTQPGLDKLLRLHLEMRTHLLMHPCVESLPAEQGLDPAPNFARPAHACDVTRFSAPD